MKNIILTSILLLVTYFLFSQSSRKETKFRENMKITQSILNPTDSISQFLYSNSQVIFKLNDINTFLYSINFKEVQRDNVNDEELDNKEYIVKYSSSDYKISELNYSEFYLPLGNTTPILDSVNSFERLIKYNKVQLDQLIINLMDVKIKKENLIRMKSLMIQQAQADSTPQSKEIALLGLVTNPKDEDLIKLNDTISQIEKLIQEKNNNVEDLIKERDEYLKMSKDNEAYILTFSVQLIEYLKIISEINAKLDFFNELSFLLFSNESFDTIYSNKQKILNKYFGAGVSSANLINACNESFVKLDSKYYSLLNTHTSMPDRNKIESSYVKLTKYHNSIDKFKYQELFKQILKTYNAINKINWTVTYQTTMISDKADKILYSIELTPIKNEYVLTNKTIRLNYDFDIKGGVKIDASAGLFYHFNLYDDKYRFEQLTDSSTQIIKENNNNQFIPSIGAIFNVYKRSNRNVKVAFNFGAGTNVEKLYYYLGSGLILGKSERIGINLGIVGGTVKRISSEYQDNKVVNLPLDQLPNEVPMQTKDPFQFGYFVGVSYNLSGKNKDDINMMLKK